MAVRPRNATKKEPTREKAKAEREGSYRLPRETKGKSSNKCIRHGNIGSNSDITQCSYTRERIGSLSSFSLLPILMALFCACSKLEHSVPLMTARRVSNPILFLSLTGLERTKGVGTGVGKEAPSHSLH